MDLGSLIDAVRSFPHLWDKKHPKYMDQLANENAWASISAIAEVSIEDCKLAWKNARERYVKERRLSTKIPSGSAPYIVKWPFYSLCNFLDNAIKQRKWVFQNVWTIGNIKKVSETVEEWQEMIIDEDGNVLPAEEDNIDNYQLESDQELINISEQDAQPSTSKELPTTLGVKRNQQSQQQQTIKKLRIERNDHQKKTKNKENAIQSLVENNKMVGESIHGLVKMLNDEKSSEVSEEDMYFGKSI
ncbi:unnamed protein product [Ceutorhynchus assimilis]|uniref:MADF domain-containing protein n=1 Tax=Ceutorhynchus assimilis TaxID=467358 RepID=A0A9P0DY04_9CUCU|nr:unnamed protein product [Ceutorhynchus assimilis]